MLIKKLFVKNIRSYETQEIVFPLGSLLLAGDIGSGKTTLLLAVEYALFGLQPGQKGSALLNSDSDSGEVSLELEIGGKNVLIERRLKRTPRGISNDYASITIDEKKEESSVTEIKNKVLTLLGYPSEFIKRNNLLYRYTVYTPQEEMKQIILEDPETRLNVLRYIFGIDKYKKIRENSSIVVSYLKEESKVLQGEVKSLEEYTNSLELKNKFVLSLKEEIKQLSDELELKKIFRKKQEIELNEIEEKILEKQKFATESEKTQILINTKFDNISSLNKDIIEFQKTLNETKEVFLEGKFEELLKKIAEKESSLEELNQRQIALTSQIGSLEQKKEEVQVKKDRIFRIDICPTCLQDVPDAHKHNILNETENQLSVIAKNTQFLQTQLEQVSPMIQQIKSEKELLLQKKLAMEITRSKQGYLEKTKSKLEQLVKTRTALEEDAELLERHLTSLKESILSFSKFIALQRKQQEILKSAFKDEKDSEISLAESNKELELIIKEIETLNSLITRKTKLKETLNEMLSLMDWISTDFLNLIDFIERTVLIKLRTEFSALFSKWFQMLVPEESLSVQIDDSFTPVIIQRECELEYSFLSGGERTAVALAYRLALNQTINSLLSKIQTSDIIMLDEPTEGFSSTQLDKMRDILEELTASQIIIVSHEQKIESFVENVIHIEKQNHVSKVINQAEP